MTIEKLEKLLQAEEGFTIEYKECVNRLNNSVFETLYTELICKAMQMVVNRNIGHPWKDMSDMELLKSAGLYEKDRVTGQEGFNMMSLYMSIVSLETDAMSL